MSLENLSSKDSFSKKQELEFIEADLRLSENNKNLNRDELLLNRYLLVGRLQELYVNFYSDFEEIDKISRNEKCNFSLLICNLQSGNVEIIMQAKDGKELMLTDFLPDGYTLKPGEEFICRTSSKEIIFDKNRLESRGFLLSLAHEIGHAYMNRQHATSDVIKFSVQVLFEWIKNLRIKYKKTVENGFIQKKIVLTAKDIDELIPDWFREKNKNFQISDERDAWAFAIKNLKKLQENGYDTFNGFANEHEVIQYVEYMLLSYEITDSKELLHRNPKKFFEEIAKENDVNKRNFVRKDNI